MKSYELAGKISGETVTPFAGVWIEIFVTPHLYKRRSVTPFAGVWIEIVLNGGWRQKNLVTPFAGVWIEINLQNTIAGLNKSLPSRECGLKYVKHAFLKKRKGHSLRGSVD